MYPYLFQPILKEIIWGGTDIRPFKGMTPTQEKIGESWELSHVDGDFSVVTYGADKGKTIDELIREYGESLLGSEVMKRFGTRFPLLIKFIDARDDISIQVHPDDALAEKRHHSFGKTEMWYVIKATSDAALYCGFSQPIDADEYVRRVEDNSIMEVLKRYNVTAGDVFFLPAGRVHAIGAGCFIAEIQQTSNITYRIYDYNRKGADGKGRELHTELAKDAIDYTFQSDYRTHYTSQPGAAVELVQCPYFTTRLLETETPMMRDYATLDSFVVYICMAGSVELRDDNGNELTVSQGQTVLFPATTQSVTLKPAPQAKLLETYIA
mgnify:FL=1